MRREPRGGAWGVPASRPTRRYPTEPRPRRRPAAPRPRTERPDPEMRLRLGAMVMAVAIGFGLLTLRVGQVQVLSADRLEALGENQRVRTLELPAERGSIFDRNGRELALSLRQQTVWANPRVISDPIATARQLSPLLGVEEPKLVERLSRDAAFVYLAR